MKWFWCLTVLPLVACKLASEYDFVVVGGGSAGAVVAARLAEVTGWSVLLLEAGGRETVFNQIPLLVAMTIPTAWDWGYTTEPPKESCLGLKGGRCIWPRGKLLGGTSVLNYMLYVRGNRRDYDNWAALGNPGWGYDDVLPYFKKSEDQTDAGLAGSSYHGVGGPLTVSQARFHTKLYDAYMESIAQQGYPIGDYNNGDAPVTFMTPQTTQRNGTRCSTAKAFLSHPPRNLHIALKTRVARVVLEGNRAVGVELVRGRQIVRARREVVLCAGALNTPQLLMLSGFGPSGHLSQLGIPVYRNLSVGRNLQDHVGLGGLTFLVNGSYGLSENLAFAPQTAAAWLTKGQGPLTSPGGVEVLGFLPRESDKDWPDIELLFAAGSANSDSGFIKLVHGLSDEVYDTVFRPIKGQTSFSLHPIALRPFSRGFIELRSRNPLDAPLFYPNYFTDQRDVEAVLRGLKVSLRLAESPAFQKFGTTLHKIPIPGCEHLQFGTDVYWECQMRHYPMMYHHQAGTCKMGPSSDPEAVVDARLRVYGVAHLRVADVSIVPVLPGCHTNAVAIMIGEKAADMIKADWGEPVSKPS